MLNSYQQKLLAGWEEVFKKGQLTFWILLALKDSPKHMIDIKTVIGEFTNGQVEADDKSMYRALRRFYDADMVSFKTEPNENGPDRKVYKLTETGIGVLEQFIQRNIKDVFYKPEIKKLLKA